MGQNVIFHQYGVADKVLSLNSKIFVFMYNLYYSMSNLAPLVLSWRVATKQVTWQLSSKFLCSLSVRVT